MIETKSQKMDFLTYTKKSSARLSVALLAILIFSAITITATSASLFSGIFYPQTVNKAHAQAQGIGAALLVPTNDVPNNLKEQGIFGLGLDAFAWQAGNILIDNVTNSIVNWINRGFEGGPAFVTNPEQFLSGVADQVAGEFIAGTELGFMCDPFQLQIRGALNFSHSSDFRINCSLSDVIANAENFAKFTEGDFNQGGWDGWFSMTQNANNNPYGAYAKANTELSVRIAGSQNIELLKLDWGNGFFSWEDENGQIQTPGAVVETQLENVLGTNLDRLEIADEFNEVVGALAGYFVRQVIGGFSGAQSGSGSGSDQNNFTGYCFADTGIAEINEPVTWTTYVNGSRSNRTTFVWSGSTPIELATSTTTSFGNANSLVVGYPSVGEKNAQGRVTANGRTKTFTCSDTVTVQGITI